MLVRKDNDIPSLPLWREREGIEPSSRTMPGHAGLKPEAHTSIASSLNYATLEICCEIFSANCCMASLFSYFFLGKVNFIESFRYLGMICKWE